MSQAQGNASSTPGPWKIDWSVSRLDIYADGGTVATLRRSTKDGPPTYDDAEARSNARLIAAAPDLLDACRKALYALKGREHDGFLREAIAKATGSAAHG